MSAALFHSSVAAFSISSKLSADFSCERYFRGRDFEAVRQNGVLNSLYLRMSNPSSDVHGGGEAPNQRFRTGRAGTDQPQQFTRARPVSGQFQCAHFFQCRIPVQIGFHTAIRIGAGEGENKRCFLTSTIRKTHSKNDLPTAAAQRAARLRGRCPAPVVQGS